MSGSNNNLYNQQETGACSNGDPSLVSECLQVDNEPLNSLQTLPQQAAGNGQIGAQNNSSSSAASLANESMQVLEEENSNSDSEAELILFFDAEPPPVYGIRFYNPNYEPPAGAQLPTNINVEDIPEVSAADVLYEFTEAMAQDNFETNATTDQANSNSSSNTWRPYENRNRIPVHRTRTYGQSGQRHRYVPAVYDEEFGGYVYIASDSDSETEPPLPPWKMVPRRGNSVSDLSQCSSDEEPVNR